ncbi:unnamed protein product [Laminaria digitata]
MALRSLRRAGVEVGGRMAGKGGRVGATIAKRNLIAGVERKSSSFVGHGQGQGHFGRPQTPSHRQGSLGAGTQLFKLVETDLMSKELTRYGPSDAEHLGLFSIQDVLLEIAAAKSALEPSAPVSETPSALSTARSAETSEELESVAAAAAPAVSEEEVLAAWGLGPRVTDVTDEGGGLGEGVQEPAEEGGAEKMAIKRTYQPSTLKRKRKHGFLYRSKTRLGQKILQRRQEKGRWRLGI